MAASSQRRMGPYYNSDILDGDATARRSRGNFLRFCTSLCHRHLQAIAVGPCTSYCTNIGTRLADGFWGRHGKRFIPEQHDGCNFAEAFRYALHEAEGISSFERSTHKRHFLGCRRTAGDLSPPSHSHTLFPKKRNLVINPAHRVVS